MLNGHTKPGTMPFISQYRLNIRKMKAELNEHRYYLEQKVEHRTEHLLKRIVFLESCNTALCNKLAAAQKELAIQKLQPASTVPKPAADAKDRAMKLYVMSNQGQGPNDANMQNEWDGDLRYSA